ncbi:RNA-guided endonuclease TnpB family protein [Clostridium sp. KNHs214]|uniref:RNA-guided endonuclease TnpB family protein n=1 Tax=Clostridium sp. KNHs214 TaxID=1540257 RepID=UPI00068C5178|nr:RNA-guided endonuclease TnpB family protein [Clostridium sp. KNHs214]
MKNSSLLNKGYKFRIYPNIHQIAKIEKNFGCVRFVYNYFLSQRIRAYDSAGKTIGYLEQQNHLPLLKKQYPWLKVADSTSLQISIRNLDKAFQNFFKNKAFGFPNFKSKKSIRKCYTVNCVNSNIVIKDGKIKLPKLKWVDAKVHRKVEGRIISATVIKSSSGKYYVSVITEQKKRQIPSTEGKNIISLQMKDFITISNDKSIYYFKYIKKIKKLERKLLSKEKESNNRKKLEKQIGKLYEKIQNKRDDFLHKLSKNIVDENQIIYIQECNVKKGTDYIENCAHLKSFSWSKFCKFLEYKSCWYNKSLIYVENSDSYLNLEYNYKSLNTNIPLNFGEKINVTLMKKILRPHSF